MGIKKAKPTKKRTVKTKRAPLLPPALKEFLHYNLQKLGGFTLCLFGGAIILSLISYHSSDPSLNTAGGDAPLQNWMGQSGAYIADILLQTLGLAAYLIGLALAVWGWRVMRHIPFQSKATKISFLLLGTLFCAVALARIPAFDSWPLGTYLGGSAGSLLLNTITSLFHGLLGDTVYLIVSVLTGLVGLALFAVSLSLSASEWKHVSTTISGLCIRILGSLKSVITDRKAVKKAYEYKPRQAVPATTTGKVEPVMTEVPKPKAIIAPKKDPVKKSRRETAERQSTLFSGDNEWVLPPLDLLQDADPSDIEARLDEQALQNNAELLGSVLQDFGVQGEILKVHPGPVVTLYEFEPAPGTKSARIIGLSDDIARSMSAVSVRAAVVPGKNVIGIELPNVNRETVYLRELLASQKYEMTSAKLPLVLGKNIGGQPVIADLARMPHLLVAGTTGSGKSVAVNTMVMSLLYRLSPEQCRFIMIDPKMLELSVYDGIPHLLSPVVTDPGKAIMALKWAVNEMEDRYRAMSKLGVRNIDGYNSKIRAALEKGDAIINKVQTGFDPDTGKPIFEEQPVDLIEYPYIVVIVDEFADLMLVAGKEVENAIQRLAQMARAAGIHLIMATQRPSVDVITGTIKANFPTRISFQVTSKIDSRTILGDGGAEQLLGMGDMLYMAAGGKIERVHGPFVDDGEVEDIVNHLKAQGEPHYVDSIASTLAEFDDMMDVTGIAGNAGQADELFDHAVAIVARDRKASTSYIQRQLQIGYNRAARIVEQMEKEGMIGPANKVGKRDIYLPEAVE